MNSFSQKSVNVHFIATGKVQLDISTHKGIKYMALNNGVIMAAAHEYARAIATSLTDEKTHRAYGKGILYIIT